MKTTLIGGSGFVGTRLIDLLRQEGGETQNVDKQQSHFFSDITVIGDVRDKDTLIRLLKEWMLWYCWRQSTGMM